MGFKVQQKDDGSQKMYKRKRLMKDLNGYIREYQIKLKKKQHKS